MIQDNKTPKDIYQAFYNLKDDVSFKLIIQWLRDNLKSEDTDNRVVIEEAYLRMGQGRAQILDAILRTNDTAYEKLMKLIK